MDSPVDRLLLAACGCLLLVQSALAHGKVSTQVHAPGAGHFIQLDRPDVVIAAILRIVAVVRESGNADRASPAVR